MTEKAAHRVREGKRYRLGRIFGADGRALILPVDHGMMMGRIPGLEDPVAMVRRLLPLGCDGFLMSQGVMERTVDLFLHRSAPSRLMTLDTFWRSPGEAISGAGLVSSVHVAARLGADCVKLLMVWNVSSRERQSTLERVAQVVTQAADYDMPVMVEPVLLGEERDERTSAAEGDAARVAMELGADIIKIGYPGLALLTRWVEELGVPLVILGGPRSQEPAQVVALAQEALAAGAAGLVIGRNVWQRDPQETSALVRSLREVVHGAAVSAG
jgi:class I fructose-bisphosphate aldolase